MPQNYTIQRQAEVECYFVQANRIVQSYTKIIRTSGPILHHAGVPPQCSEAQCEQSNHFTATFIFRYIRYGTKLHYGMWVLRNETCTPQRGNTQRKRIGRPSCATTTEFCPCIDRGRSSA